MSLANKAALESALRDILQLISDIGSRRFDSRAPLPEEPMLRSIVEKLNFAAQSLAKHQCQKSCVPLESAVTKFEEIYYNSPLGIVELDQNLKILRSNPAYQSMLEYSEEELFGKSVLEFTCMDDVENSQARANLLKQGLGSTDKFEKRYFTRTGKTVWVRVTTRLIKSESGNKTLLSVIEDITEVKNKCQELEKIIAEFKDAQKTAKIGSWSYDLKTGHQIWSSEHYRIFEIEEPQSTENLHKLYRERIHPDDLRKLDEVIAHSVSNGESFVYNHRVYLDGGKRIKHVRGIGKVTRDAQGNPVSISGTCQDLTELISLQEQNKFVLEAMGIGIWRFNPLSKDLFWDDSMYRLFEIDAKDFSEHYLAWESSLSPEAKHLAVTELTLALEGKKDFDTTFEILTRSGNRKFVGGRGVVLRNENSEPTLMLGINWDRTSEHKRQLALEESQSLLQSIIDASPSSIFVKDLNGKYLVCNETFAKTIGKTIPEVIGRNARDLFPEKVAFAMSKNDADVLARNHHNTFEEQLPVAGRLDWHLVSLFPIRDTRGFVFSVGGIITNVQEAKDIRDKYLREIELERAKSIHTAKLASLGEMSAGIAHEINNPLAVISGSIPLLSRLRLNDGKFLAKVAVLEKSANRIEKIVKGLKKFSRSSETKKFKRESLLGLVLDALVFSEVKAKLSGVNLSVNVAPEIIIFCDGVEIEQVLINLINNGIDAVRSQTERWIRIDAFSDGVSVIVQVVDSGPGIPEDIEKKLFQPFFTTKEVGEGTGLGLSIAKGILDSHNAVISLKREMKNTCFEIVFPVSQSDQDKASA